LNRDGLNHRKKRVRKGTKKIKKPEYKKNMFISLINALELYSQFQTPDGFTYLRDPYAILLLLDPIGVDVPLEHQAEYPTITCEEYYNAVLEGKMEEILPKMTLKEKMYCQWWAKFNEKPPMGEILELLCKAWNIRQEPVRATYEFQPDPIPIAFGITAPRIKKEPLTPVIGIEYSQIYPSPFPEKRRFPCCVTKNRFNTEKFVQIHKDGDVFKCFSKGKERDDLISLENYSYLTEIKHSYVVEGFVDREERLAIYDVLNWNDIWMYRRPLNERLKWLWHFEPLTEAIAIVHTESELRSVVKGFNNNAIIRNLNTPYSHTAGDSHLEIGEQTVILQVGGRRGGRGFSYLNTSDKNSVFQIPEKIDKEDWGDIVEVNQQGDIIRVMDDNIVPDSWNDVAIKWGKPIKYEDWANSIRLPKCSWFSNSKEIEDERVEEVRRRHKARKEARRKKRGKTRDKVQEL